MFLLLSLIPDSPTSECHEYVAVSYKAQYPFDCLREDGNRQKPKSLWASVSAGCSSPAVLSTVGTWGLGAGKLKSRNRGGTPLWQQFVLVESRNTVLTKTGLHKWPRVLLFFPNH